MTKRTVNPRTITGPRIKRQMKEKGITQSELANMTGLGLSTIKQYTSGSRLPGEKNLSLIADALGVSVIWLLGGEYRTEKEETEAFFKRFDSTVDHNKLLEDIKKAEQFNRTFDFSSAVHNHYTKYTDSEEGRVITDSLEDHLTARQLKKIRKQIEGFIFYTIDSELKKGETK